jgi:hypothetical protein
VVGAVRAFMGWTAAKAAAAAATATATAATAAATSEQSTGFLAFDLDGASSRPSSDGTVSGYLLNETVAHTKCSPIDI